MFQWKIKIKRIIANYTILSFDLIINVLIKLWPLLDNWFDWINLPKNKFLIHPLNCTNKLDWFLLLYTSTNLWVFPLGSSVASGFFLNNCFFLTQQSNEWPDYLSVDWFFFFWTSTNLWVLPLGSFASSHQMFFIPIFPIFRIR